MAQVRRVTPEQVKAAYEKTGMEYRPRIWHSIRENACCPLTAVAMSAGVYKGIRDDIEIALEELGYERDYITGFIRAIDGFNGAGPEGFITEHRQLGYEDGLAVKKALEG